MRLSRSGARAWGSRGEATDKSREPHAVKPGDCDHVTSGYYILNAKRIFFTYKVHVDRLVQERRNSIAPAMELRLTCTNPPMNGLYDMTVVISVQYLYCNGSVLWR